MKNLPSAEDIRYFESQIAYWQVVLGLQGWRFERSNKTTSAMADVSVDYPAKMAVYRVGNFGSALVNEHSLSTTALHECLHVFLHDLIRTAQNKPTEEELDAAEHQVINLLEKLLYDWKNKNI
jgi:hypothetical protein